MGGSWISGRCGPELCHVTGRPSLGGPRRNDPVDAGISDSLPQMLRHMRIQLNKNTPPRLRPAKKWCSPHLPGPQRPMAFRAFVKTLRKHFQDLVFRASLHFALSCSATLLPSIVCSGGGSSARSSISFKPSATWVKTSAIERTPEPTQPYLSSGIARASVQLIPILV